MRNLYDLNGKSVFSHHTVQQSLDCCESQLCDLGNPLLGTQLANRDYVQGHDEGVPQNIVPVCWETFTTIGISIRAGRMRRN